MGGGGVGVLSDSSKSFLLYTLCVTVHTILCPPTLHSLLPHTHHTYGSDQSLSLEIFVEREVPLPLHVKSIVGRCQPVTHTHTKGTRQRRRHCFSWPHSCVGQSSGNEVPLLWPAKWKHLGKAKHTKEQVWQTRCGFLVFSSLS